MRPERELAAVAQRLKASPRQRLELIEELGADADALREELQRRGYDARAARRMAAGQVVPSREALAELEAQHAPRLGRWIGKTGLAGGIERMGATATAILAGSAVLAALWRQDPGAASSLLGWSLVVVVALLSSNWARAAKRLWIDGDLRPETRRVLWARQVGLIVAAVSLGGLGASWEVCVGLEALGGPPAAAWTAVQRAVFFAVLAVGAALFGLFGWLALIPRFVSDEACERRIAALLNHSRRFVNPRTETRRH